jgi:hypothetical protein
MSVDLISGVMQAADSRKLTNAHRKLAGAKLPVQTEKSLFATLVSKLRQTSVPSSSLRANDLVERVLAAADPQKLKAASANLSDLPNTNVNTQSASLKRDPMIALEGMMMSKLVDQMMPKANDSIYGSGLAGDTWRGFAVNEMSETIAASDPLQLSASAAGNDPTSFSNLYGVGSDSLLSSKRIRPFAVS